MIEKKDITAKIEKKLRKELGLDGSSAGSEKAAPDGPAAETKSTKAGPREVKVAGARRR